VIMYRVSLSLRRRLAGSAGFALGSISLRARRSCTTLASSPGRWNPLMPGSTVLPAKKSLSFCSEANVKVMSGLGAPPPASQKPCSTRTSPSSNQR
jgi:hypothetical protein